MATADQVAELRRMISEPTPATYTDEFLGDLIDTTSSLNVIAAKLWREKAASYAEIVDVKEGSSSRSLGDIHEQALSMASQYDALAAGEGNTTTTRRSRTRAIERA